MLSLLNSICLFTCWLPSVSSPPKQTTPGSEPDIAGKTFDYIIVGGGLTGLTVANRLSEDSSRSVLVLENGNLVDDVSTRVPSYANALNTALMYNITSAPNVNIGDQTKPVWVGNVVGGGSVVNGMAFDRASAADYDAWEKLGNNGWGWSSLLPYFKKSTTFTPPSTENVKAWGTTWDASYYGTNGPIQASFPPFEYSDITTIWAAYKAQGIPLPKEHASGNAVGAYWIPTALQPKTQTRSDARNGYYDPIKSRRNLILATSKSVNEILFDQGLLTGYKAKGVQYVSRKDNSVAQVYASKEVILAAGSVFTPQLLQLSGFGPKDILNAAGVRIKKERPAIGANLQDHPNANMQFDLKNMAIPNPLSGLDPALNASAWAQYEASKTGPITQAHGSSLAFLSLRTISDNYESIVSTIKSQNARKYLPSVYGDSKLLAGFNRQRDIIVNLHSRTDAAVAEFPMVAFGLAIGALQRPLSRGTVTLNPSNKYGAPVVQWNTFQNPIDRQIVVEMVRWIRQHWARPELKKFQPVEIVPGTGETDDEIIEALIQTKALEASFAHMSGSCAMMPEAYGGVVGSDLLMYGVKRLSIVDGSIIPLVPATHLQATMYAIAEKAADIIKARNPILSIPSIFNVFNLFT